MHTDDDLPSQDVAEAEARRRRVFKRTAASIIFCIVVLIGVRLWWGYEARRRLQAEIDGYRAAGEPILVADFIPQTKIPNEQNAAVLYQEASAAIVREPTTETEVSFVDLLRDPRVCAAYPDDVRVFMEANAETLRLLRQARGRPKVDWGTRFTSPMIAFMLPMLSPHRELAKFARTAAAFRHQEGDHAEAVETLLDLHAMAARLGERGNAVVISHLVAIAIESIAVGELEDITPTLVSADAKFAEKRPVRPATRWQITSLMDALLEEEVLRSSWREALYAERAELLDMAMLLVEGRISPGFLLGTGPGGPSGTVAAGLWGPVYRLDALWMVRYATQVRKAGLAHNWPMAEKMLSGCEPPRDPPWSIQGMARPVSRILTPSFDRCVLLHFRTLATRRMAATALAIRLYELDHGRRPGSLDELVPACLDALPADPFAADGRTFGYKPDAAWPILYSIGPDGRDDAGEYAEKKHGWVDNDPKDIPFFLNGDRPRRPLKLSSDE